MCEFFTEIAFILQAELSEVAAFEEISPGASGSHRTSLSTNTNPVDVLSINELLESVIYNTLSTLY